MPDTKTDTPEKVRVRVDLAPETRDRLYALAKADGRTLSAFVTKLIDAAQEMVGLGVPSNNGESDA